MTSDSNDYPPVVHRTRLVDEVTQYDEANKMEHVISVQFADKSGQQNLLLSPAETAELIQENASSWAYVDSTLVQANQIDETNLSTVSSVRILPGLVGGC